MFDQLYKLRAHVSGIIGSSNREPTFCEAALRAG